jgi:hypothetical protein
MEEKRESVIDIIKRQNIEENPCREGGSTGPTNSLPIKNLPMQSTVFLFVLLIRKAENLFGTRSPRDDLSGIFPIGPLPLVNFLN